MRGLKERYEIHHGIRIKDAALVRATVLSKRYIRDRFLPDKAIVKNAIGSLNTRLAEQELTLAVSDDVLELLARKGYDPVYGARPLRRVIRTILENALAKALLAKTFDAGSTIDVGLSADGAGVVFS